MKIAHQNKKATLRNDRVKPDSEKLDKLPRPANWFECNERVKIIYRDIGKKLLEMRGMREFDSYALLMLATALDQYVYATREINRRENQEPGTGYIQTFLTGASNVSVEVTLRDRAFKQIIELASKFGLTLRDRMQMKTPQVDPDQIPLFDMFTFSQTS
jgi:phage terminase small subunit